MLSKERFRYALAALGLISLFAVFVSLYSSEEPGELIDPKYNPEKHTVSGTVRDVVLIRGDKNIFFLISLQEISDVAFIAPSESVALIERGEAVQIDVPEMSDRVITDRVLAEQYQMLTPVDAVRTERGLPIIIYKK